MHLYEAKKIVCLEKFAHINAVPITGKPDLFVLEGVTESDLVAMTIMGMVTEDQYAFEADQINPNGITNMVMMIPGEAEYRIFEISSATYEADT
jgi:hypothetical protein